jgi:hypothetical protein
MGPSRRPWSTRSVAIPRSTWRNACCRRSKRDSPQADLYVKRALDPDSMSYSETSCDMGIYTSRGATLVGNGALG